MKCRVVPTYLCNDFHLLALAVLRFRDRGLESLEKFVIKFLHLEMSVHEKLVELLRA